MIKVAILDDYQNVSLILGKFEKSKKNFVFQVFNQPFENEDSTIEQLKDFEVLLVMRERTPITKKIISNLKNLKLIITSGMRNNSIDLLTAKEKKILVCGTDSVSNSTAELTWALILGLARNLREESENMYQGYWQTTLGCELKGKTLGIIGLGKIGAQVSKVALAFGMNVVAWSENLKLSIAKDNQVLPVTKEELLEKSDFITIHTVLSDRTKNLITKKDLELMKETAFLINTSRGHIVNEFDLVEALEKNIIAGAGLDVYDIEPLPENHKLRFLPNALLLPHLGFITKENYEVFYSQMFENLEAFKEGKPIRVIQMLN
jgi:phosphoglycerate dehydrogenase-like enzyme